MRYRVLGLLVIVLGAGGGPARGQIWSLPHPHKEGTPDPGPPRCIPHTDERAGYPRCLADHLEPTRTSGGIGYYVGGGAPIGHRGPRCRNMGTWGWDETGSSHFRSRVVLGWWRRPRYQGGQGAYATDGPHVPDVIYGINSFFDGLIGGGEEGGAEGGEGGH